MQIAVDAMGGDLAPRAVVEGAFLAATTTGCRILLVGRSRELEETLAPQGEHGGRIEIVHAEEVVGMDEPAISPIRKKRRSSVRVCAELVKEGRAQAMVTAGNTGAAMIAAKMVIGTIPGVDRPALAAVFPAPRGRTVVLDVGANIDSKPAHLRQFAVMGHFYAQQVLEKESPRIGLLSIGEEESKGTDLTRRVFKEMESSGFNFVGNVEGHDVFNGTVDVVVCDGFVGNILLKSAESLAELILHMIREEMGQTWRTRLAGALALPAFASLRRRTDSREFGAVPLLGVQGGCFIGHGSSNAKAVSNSIQGAVEFSAAGLHNKIRLNVAELHSREDRLLGRGDSQEVSVS